MDNFLWMENEQNIFYELFLHFVFTLLEAMQWYLLFKLVSLTNLKKLSKTLILSVFQPFYIYPSFTTSRYHNIIYYKAQFSRLIGILQFHFCLQIFMVVSLSISCHVSPGVSCSRKDSYWFISFSLQALCCSTLIHN